MEESSLVQQLSLAMDNIRRAEKVMKKAINAEVEPIFLLLHFAEVSKGGSVPVSAMKDAMCVSAAARHAVHQKTGKLWLCQPSGG